DLAPARRDGRRSSGRPDGPGARPPGDIDPLHPRWLRGRPDAPGARVHGHRRRASPDGRALRRDHGPREAGGRRGAPRRRRGGTNGVSVVEPPGDGEFVLLGIPDVNGSLRGKAMRPAAFASALHQGTVMTDLILGLDPVDTPITDYEQFGIRTGAADLLVRPDPGTLHDLSWRPGWQVCLATPAWPDGTACEFASREVLRRVLDAMAELGYEVLAAAEYEVRLWDGAGGPMSSGISY